jgi:hypothetical protein
MISSRKQRQLGAPAGGLIDAPAPTKMDNFPSRAEAMMVSKLFDIIVMAQRQAAQPLGRFRYVVTILAGILQSHSSVLSLSLGQVGCSRVLGRLSSLLNAFPP